MSTVPSYPNTKKYQVLHDIFNYKAGETMFAYEEFILVCERLPDFFLPLPPLSMEEAVELVERVESNIDQNGKKIELLSKEIAELKKKMSNKKLL